MNWLRRSLSRTFLFTLLLISVVPVAGLTYFLVGNSSDSLTNQMQSYVQVLARSKAQEIELKLDQVQSHTEIAAQAAELVLRLKLPEQALDQRMQVYALDERGVLSLPAESYSVKRDLYPTDIVSNVFVGNTIEVSDALKQDVVTTESLEVIFGGTKHAGIDTQRIYVTTVTGMTRIYPWEASERFSADWDPRQDIAFVEASPDNNPRKSAVWTAPYRDATGMTWMVTTATPLYDDEDAFMGIIAQDVAIGSLLDVVLDIQLPGDDGYGFLIDEEGNTITHPDASLAGTNLGTSATEGLSTVIHHMLSTPEGILDFEDDGAQQTVAFATIPNTHWRLGIVIPQQAVIAPATAMRVNGVAAGAVAAISAIVVALLLSRHIVNPLRELVIGVTRIGEGDSTYQLDSDAENEVGQLARAFNTMAEKVYARERRLKAKIQELKVEIDFSEKDKEVKRITESDYFRRLQMDAREMKQKLKAL